MNHKFYVMTCTTYVIKILIVMIWGLNLFLKFELIFGRKHNTGRGEEKDREENRRDMGAEEFSMQVE